MTTTLPASKRAQAEATLWRAGRTAYRLPPTPRKVYDDIRLRWGEPYVLLAHRNFWKSGICMTIADEECRRQKDRVWAVILKTKDHATKVIRAIMHFLLASCPKELRPKPLKSDFAWVYPNGSQVLFFGADHDHIETARGQGFDGAVFDEAGHQDNLRENLHSIILPALAKRGRGQVILPSTPSRVPGHYFETLCERARAAGRYSFVPASQNQDMTDEWRAARAAECGGFDSLEYLVEYECQFVADPTTTVLPGITEARSKGLDGKPALVQPVAAPGPREWYRAMDIGGKHMTGVLWGFYEPENDSVRIARELTDRNASAPELAKGIRETEADLWSTARPERLESWADNNNVYLLHTLHTEYGITFKPTRKDEKMAQLSSLRKMIAEGRFVVDPSCTQTLATLRKAQWASAGKGFAETPEIGHADLLDAALYLVRNVRRRPYPEQPVTVDMHAGVATRSRFHTAGMQKLSDALEPEALW